MCKFALLKAEILKIFGDIKAYWFNYIFGNINVFFLFLGVFYAFSNSLGTNEDVLNLIFGLMIWYYGVHAIDLIAIIIEEESEQGTLEQIYTTDTPFIKVLFYRIISQLVFDTIKGVFVFVLCLLTFKIPFSMFIEINWVPTLFIFFSTLIGLYGIGYMVAGLSMIYKKVTAVAGACSNLLLFFSGIIVDVQKLPPVFSYIAKLFPLYWGSQCIKVLIDNEFSWRVLVVSEEFRFLFITIISCIFIGISVFVICERKAIRKGNLSHY